MKFKLMWLFILLGFVFVSGQVFAEMPGPKVGEVAPDFTATTHEGKAVTLSELYAKGPVVLVFYRGAWCPICNVHLKSFQDRYSEFEKVGASILAVSVDLKEYANKTVQENALSFDVVSDPAADILNAYGLIFRVPKDTAKMYKSEYKIDLEKHSGREDHAIAIPGTYVINNKGIIEFAFASEDYKVRTKPEEVLEVLK